MAGMFMSNIMMFFPEMTQWVCLIGLAIFVFGIYIPYDQYRQKKKWAGKNPQRKQKASAAPEEFRNDRKRRQEQLKVLREAGILTEEEYREKIRNCD